MILGLSSYTFAWSVGVPGKMPPDPITEHDLIDRTLEAGLSCLHIGDNLPLHTFSQERLEALRTRADQEKIRLEVGARKLTEQNLGLYISIATFLHAPLLRFIIDDAGYEPEISTVMPVIKNQLTALKKHGIKLGIENHDRFRAKQLSSMMEAIADESVGIRLDCVNSLGAGEGIEHVSQVLTPHTINLHIKDYKIGRLPHKMGFIVEGCPAGKGMTDLPRLLAVLSPYKRCESAVLEQWVVPEPGISETVLKEAQWAREGLQYLRGTRFFEIKQYNIL
jgi:sugar phosphate isomerase/epimerase